MPAAVDSFSSLLILKVLEGNMSVFKTHNEEVVSIEEDNAFSSKPVRNVIGRIGYVNSSI